MRSVYLPTKPILALIILLLISVGSLGASYSLFTDQTRIQTCVSMGNIDVVFSELYIVEGSSESDSGITQAAISNNGKNISINVADAVAGYSSCIYYEVKNNGTIPVVYQIVSSGGNGILNVFTDGGSISAGGGTGQGCIYITVGNESQAGEICCLNLVLNFQQAIVEG